MLEEREGPKRRSANMPRRRLATLLWVLAIRMGCPSSEYIFGFMGFGANSVVAIRISTLNNRSSDPGDDESDRHFELMEEMYSQL